jgi:hypothetical protein
MSASRCFSVAPGCESSREPQREQVFGRAVEEDTVDALVSQVELREAREVLALAIPEGEVVRGELGERHRMRFPEGGPAH